MQHIVSNVKNDRKYLVHIGVNLVGAVSGVALSINI